MAATTDEIWGWETFFGEVSTFLCRLQRQEGRANELFTDYALERLEVIAVNMTNIRNVHCKKCLLNCGTIVVFHSIILAIMTVQIII